MLNTDEMVKTSDGYLGIYKGKHITNIYTKTGSYKVYIPSLLTDCYYPLPPEKIKEKADWTDTQLLWLIRSQGASWYNWCRQRFELDTLDRHEIIMLSMAGRGLITINELEEHFEREL